MSNNIPGRLRIVCSPGGGGRGVGGVVRGIGLNVSPCDYMHMWQSVLGLFNKMRFSSYDKVLILHRRDLKFGPKRSLKTLCKKIDETGSTERKAGNGRPRQFGFQKTLTLWKVWFWAFPKLIISLIEDQIELVKYLGIIVGKGSACQSHCSFQQISSLIWASLYWESNVESRVDSLEHLPNVHFDKSLREKQCQSLITYAHHKIAFH